MSLGNNVGTDLLWCSFHRYVRYSKQLPGCPECLTINQKQLARDRTSRQMKTLRY